MRDVAPIALRLLLIFAVGSSLAFGRTCPKGCSCFQSTVRCDGMRFVSMPRVENDTTTLYVSPFFAFIDATNARARARERENARVPPAAPLEYPDVSNTNGGVSLYSTAGEGGPRRSFVYAGFVCYFELRVLRPRVSIVPIVLGRGGPSSSKNIFAQRSPRQSNRLDTEWLFQGILQTAHIVSKAAPRRGAGRHFSSVCILPLAYRISRVTPTPPCPLIGYLATIGSSN